MLCELQIGSSLSCILFPRERKQFSPWVTELQSIKLSAKTWRHTSFATPIIYLYFELITSSYKCINDYRIGTFYIDLEQRSVIYFFRTQFTLSLSIHAITIIVFPLLNYHVFQCCLNFCTFKQKEKKIQL